MAVTISGTVRWVLRHIAGHRFNQKYCATSRKENDVSGAYMSRVTLQNLSWRRRTFFPPCPENAMLKVASGPVRALITSLSSQRAVWYFWMDRLIVVVWVNSLLATSAFVTLPRLQQRANARGHPFQTTEVWTQGVRGRSTRAVAYGYLQWKRENCWIEPKELLDSIFFVYFLLFISI